MEPIIFRADYGTMPITVQYPDGESVTKNVDVTFLSEELADATNDATKEGEGKRLTEQSRVLLDKLNAVYEKYGFRPFASPYAALAMSKRIIDMGNQLIKKLDPTWEASQPPVSHPTSQE